MDAIKDLNASVGQVIPAVISPTLKIFTPLLLKNKEAILSVPRKEESYGPHSRQKLDIYLSTQKSNQSPILVFFYGGGFIGGDKIIPIIPDGLVHHNVGSYFAQKGITTIIPDYRRVNSEAGGEDAVFPSGGDDVSLVLKWLETFDHKGSGNFVIMGNSAGGVHVSTFLLGPQYLEQRKSLVTGEKGIKFVGAINISTPFHFKSSTGRAEVLKAYYGSEKEVENGCPYGLLEAIERAGKSRQEAAVPKLLILIEEFNPKEITHPVHDFAELANKTWGDAVEFQMVDGHNHISPPVALLSGEGEEWGEEVAKWIKSAR